MVFLCFSYRKWATIADFPNCFSELDLKVVSYIQVSHSVFFSISYGFPMVFLCFSENSLAISGLNGLVFRKSEAETNPMFPFLDLPGVSGENCPEKTNPLNARPGKRLQFAN